MLFVIIFVFGSALASAAENTERQSLTSILLQAESFLAGYSYNSPYPARSELSRLDSRLNLKPCDTPLSIKFIQAQKTMGNTSLTIRCESPVNWQIRLPVKVDIYQDVAVTKSPMIKGQTLDALDIKYRKKRVSGLHQGYFTEKDSLERLQAKRNLPANSILTTGNLAPRLMVTSGQQVTIVLNFEGLQIKSTGKALQSASHGQLVKVRNTQSNKIIEGTVASEGVVHVRL